jgi:mitochondrial fission protein ELM1
MANRDSSGHEHGPVIWLITDQKPGHRNQLRGLGNRLRVLTGASLHWVPASDYPVSRWRALLGCAPRISADLPSPDLIIAAGSSTHRLLLALRRFQRARTLVLMKPGFPLRLVSGAIIPAHDGLTESDRVLVTEGVINTMTPLAQLTPKQEALALIGGPSRHTSWDDAAIVDQIRTLITEHPGWRWTISNSRRTPESLTRQLDSLQSLHVSVVDHRRTHDTWLNHQLSASRAVWVTPESVSMVSEAVTSGVPAGLLDVPLAPGSRIAAGIQRFVEQKLARTWSDRSQVMIATAERHSRFWEANRAARWVIDRGLLPMGVPRGKRTT